jgi:hypothetical protein
MNPTTRKRLGVASAVLSLLAWLNKQFHVFSSQVTAWLTLGAGVTGLVARYA